MAVSRALGTCLSSRSSEAGAAGSREHLLRTEERSERVRGAFVMRGGARVDNLRVLLLDDVMTTGATLEARALREAGARLAVGLTAARAVRHANPVAGESQS